jgi:hypothetical protein
MKIGRPPIRMVLETTPKLSIKALREAGGLLAGMSTVWLLDRTGPPLSVIVRAEAVPAPARIFVAISGQAEVPVWVDRQPRHYGGEQVFLRCPTCGGSRYALHVVHGRQLGCRVCAKLMYRYKRVPYCPASALRRATKLRRRLGGVLFGPPPSRPDWVRRDYYAQWLAELSTWEARALAASSTTKGDSPCHEQRDQSSRS